MGEGNERKSCSTFHDADHLCKHSWARCFTGSVGGLFQQFSFASMPIYFHTDCSHFKFCGCMIIFFLSYSSYTGKSSHSWNSSKSTHTDIDHVKLTMSKRNIIITFCSSSVVNARQIWRAHCGSEIQFYNCKMLFSFKFPGRKLKFLWIKLNAIEVR